MISLGTCKENILQTRDLVEFLSSDHKLWKNLQVEAQKNSRNHWEKKILEWLPRIGRSPSKWT